MKMTKKSEKPEAEEAKQLDLGIKDPFKNKIYKIKGKTDNFLLQLEVRKFFKDPFFWFVIVLSFTMLIQQTYWVTTHFAQFPTLTPILNYNLSASARLLQKEFLYIFPFISLFSIIVSTLVTSNYYNKEKMLSKLVLLCCLLACISGSIMLIHLIIS
jgi:hypothetical protein